MADTRRTAPPTSEEWAKAESRAEAGRVAGVLPPERLSIAQPEPEGLVPQFGEPGFVPLRRRADGSFSARKPDEAPIVGEADFIPHVPVTGRPGEFRRADLEAKQEDDDARVFELFLAAEEPTREAAILEIVNATNLPIDVVEGGIAELQRSMKAAGFDPRTWREDNPALARELDSRNGLKELVFEEEQISDVSLWLRQFGAANDVAAVELQIAMNAGVPFTEEEDAKLNAKLDRLRAIETAAGERKMTWQRESELAGIDIGIDAWGRKFRGEIESVVWTRQIALDTALLKAEMSGNKSAIDAARRASFVNERQARRMSEELGAQPKYDLGTGIAAGVAQFGIDVVEGTASHVSLLASMGAGAAVGYGLALIPAALAKTGKKQVFRQTGAVAASYLSKLFGGVSSFAREAGGSYKTLKYATDDQGRRVGVKIALAGAVVAGLIKSGIEIANMNQLVGVLGIGKNAAANPTIAVRNALADRGFRHAWAAFGAVLARHGLLEYREEALQETTDFLTEYGARSLASPDKQDFRTGELISRAHTAGMKGLAGSVSSSTVGGVVGLYRDAGEIMAHKINAERTRSISGLAESPIAQKLPTQIANLVKHETAISGKQVTHLYVDPARLTETMQGDAVNTEKLARELLGENGQERLEKAFAERSDAPGHRATLEIPLEEFLEKWGGKEITKLLEQDITTRQGGMTLREEGMDPMDVRELAEKLADEDQVAQDAELQPGPWEERFVKDAYDQLLETQAMDSDEARSQIVVHRAVIRTMARKLGKSAEDTFKNWTLNIRSEASEGLGASRHSRHMMKALGEMNDKQRAEVMWVDPNIGIYSARGFGALPVREGFDFIAEYSIEGTKWVNDQAGHDKGNELYRLAGQTLGKIKSIHDAAKWGGDFVSSVRGGVHALEVREQLERDLLARLKELNPEDNLEGLQVTVAVSRRDENLGLAVQRAHELNIRTKTEEELGGLRAVRGARPKGIPTEDPSALRLGEEVAQPRELTKELLQRAAELSDEQVFNEAFINPKTGLYTREAFFLLPKMEHVIAIDLNGLRKINDAHGEWFGDKVLETFGVLGQLAGGNAVAMAHFSGDEFAAMTDDADLAQFFVDILAEVADGTTVEDKETGEVLNGISFGYGIGADYNAADLKVKPQKLKGVEFERQERQKRARSAQDIRPGDREQRRRGQVLAGGAKQADTPQRAASLRDRSSKGRAAARARLQVYRERLGIFREARDAVSVAAALSSIKSPESHAAGELVGDRIHPLITPPNFFSQQDAFEQVMSASFPEGADSSPTEQADHKYALALENRGPMPGPFPGGTFDSINERLNLRKGSRVKGLRHAWDLMMREGVGSRVEKAQHAIDQLKKVPGLEKMALPQEFLDERAQAEERKEQEASEIAYWVRVENGEVMEDEWDTSFDVDTFYQPELPGAERKRGLVAISKRGIRRTFSIFLAKDADLSTFMHEAAHTYYEMMSEIAKAPDAASRVVEDFGKIQKWLGATPGEKITDAQQEKFARGFEKYLLEGKAPSPSLVEAFSMFRHWLTQIYKTLADLDVELSDEIRGVFDRMLATDGQIKQMKDAAGFNTPLWTSPEQAGMTPREWADYHTKRVEAGVQVTTLVHRQVAEADASAAKRFRSKEAKKFKVQAAKEWDDLDFVKADQYIRLGKTREADGTVVENNVQGKLNRKVVHGMIGKESPLAIRLKRRLIEGGEHPSTVAHDSFGFRGPNPGLSMLEAVGAMPTKKDWVGSRAKELMVAEHPELNAHIEELDKMVLWAIHNNKLTDQQLRREFDAIEKNRKKKGEAEPGGSANAFEGARRAAVGIVGDMRPKRLDAGNELRTERRMAHNAAIEISKGNERRALDFKIAQMVARHKWLELTKAVTERKRFVKLIKQMADRKRRAVLNRAGQDYLDAADRILEALGIKPRELLDDGRITLGEVLAKLTLEDGGPAFDVVDLIDLIDNPPDGGWKNGTVDQMRVSFRALTQLYTAARNVNRVTLEEQNVDLSDYLDRVAEDAELRPDLGPIDDSQSRAARWGSNMLATLREPQSILRMLGTTVYNTLWRGSVNAKEDESNLTIEVGKFVNDNWENLPKAVQKRRFELMIEVEGVHVDVERIGRKPIQDRMWMMMVAMNMGNRGNRDRLLGGYEWNEQEVLRWLNRNMSKAEWQFVESVWKLMDEKLFPRVATTHAKAKGLPPPKVEALTILTPYGEVSGGYFPAAYDPLVSKLGDKQTRQALEGGSYHQTAAATSVSQNFTKARADKYEDVIRLDWQVFPNHVMQVIHYVTHDEFVRNARTILTNDRFKAIVRRTLGERFNAQLTDPKGGWLAAVAGSRHDAPPMNMLAPNGALAIGKNALAVSAVGWSIPLAANAIVEPIGAVIGVHGPKARYMMRSYIMANPLNPFSGWSQVRERAMTLGFEPRHRQQNNDDNVRDYLEEMGRSGRRWKLTKARDAITDTAWFFFNFFDKLSTTIIWDAMFVQKVAAGFDEKSAAFEADEAVRASMHVQDNERRSAFLRDRRGMGLVTMFYGFFNHQYNMQADIWDPALVRWTMAQSISQKFGAVPQVTKAAAASFALLVTNQLMGEIIGGHGPEEDEDLADWLVRKMLAAPFTLFPIVGGAAEAAANVAVNWATDNGVTYRGFSSRTVPGLAMADRIARSLGKFIDDDEDFWPRALALLQVAGIITKLPPGSTAGVRAIQYGMDPDDTSALGRIEGYLHGEKDPQPGNLFTLPGTIIDAVQ